MQPGLGQGGRGQDWSSPRCFFHPLDKSKIETRFLMKTCAVPQADEVVWRGSRLICCYVSPDALPSGFAVREKPRRVGAGPGWPTPVAPAPQDACQQCTGTAPSPSVTSPTSTLCFCHWETGQTGFVLKIGQSHTVNEKDQKVLTPRTGLSA